MICLVIVAGVARREIVAQHDVEHVVVDMCGDGGRQYLARETEHAAHRGKRYATQRRPPRRVMPLQRGVEGDVDHSLCGKRPIRHATKRHASTHATRHQHCRHSRLSLLFRTQMLEPPRRLRRAERRHHDAQEGVTAERHHLRCVVVVADERCGGEEHEIHACAHDYVEPEHYLPIVPTVLSNTTMGIANGYSFHSNAWNPVDVLDCCLEILKSKKGVEQFKTVVRPYLRDIPQDNWKLESGQWYCYGEWKTNQAKDLMTITNLPSDTTYVEFEKLLNKLCDKQEIKDYKDLSEDGNVHYEVQFFKGQLAKEIKSDRSGKRLANKFKLIKKLPDDLLWLLDENGKLKYFKDRYEVIKYFVNWRLTVYVERKKKLVKILEEKYKNNSELVKFIELVCKGKLKIRNRSKVDIKPDMDAQHLPMALLATPMSKVTIEERDELLKQNEEIKKYLEYIKNTTEKQMYVNDLQSLKQSLLKDF